MPRFNTFLTGRSPHRIAWSEWGEPESPRVIFCVHGLTRNGSDFDYLASALSGRAESGAKGANYRIICPDMAGRGKSEWLKDPLHYNYATYVADCLALLDHLGVTQCDWVGTSMGGIVGMMVAASQPQRITRLVLNDVGAVVAAEGLRRIMSYAGAKERFETREEAQEYLRSVCASFGITEDEHWRHLFAVSIEPHPAGGFRFAYDPEIGGALRRAAQTPEGEKAAAVMVQDVNLWPVWSQVACPVLILRGAESDILRRDTAEAMRASRDGVEIVEIANVGHAPTLMPRAQTDIVASWLARTPPYTASHWMQTKAKLAAWLHQRLTHS